MRTVINHSLNINNSYMMMCLCCMPMCTAVFSRCFIPNKRLLKG